MVKKYKIVKIPMRAYNQLQKKQSKMARVVNKITRQQRSVPMTKVISALSEQPLYLDDPTVLKMSRKKKKCAVY